MFLRAAAPSTRGAILVIKALREYALLCIQYRPIHPDDGEILDLDMDCALLDFVCAYSYVFLSLFV